MLRDPSLVPLSHQHHNGLALCVLVERSLKGDATPANLARLAARINDRFELELANHFELEEQLLFPALDSHCGRTAIVTDLIAEHRALEALAAALREAPGAEKILAFTALLRSHIRREENELFEQAQRDLPRPVLDLLGAELDRRAVRICL
jgi:hemerythrin-like domain-containing protein